MHERPAAPSILATKQYGAPSVFQPENLLRAARRQRGLVEQNVPAVRALDPDGDLARAPRHTGLGRRGPGWACYHTELLVTLHQGIEIGVVGLAVGAPFAVLVAEQLFASGCRLLLSVTSAGQIVPRAPTREGASRSFWRISRGTRRRDVRTPRIASRKAVSAIGPTGPGHRCGSSRGVARCG